jgi:tetratricopeptide (TPR) repeat protein
MTSAASAFADGVKLHQAGRLADAEEIYRRVLAASPDDFDCLHSLGVIFLQRGDYARAATQIEAALKQNPTNVFALNNRGSALQKLDRFDQALASYEQAIALQPDYVGALLNRANLLKELKRFAEALAAYDRVLAVAPDSFAAHANRGDVLNELKQFDAALASCDRALALRPDMAELHANRGNALWGLKRYEEAMQSYDRALTLRPDMAEVHFNRGSALHEGRRFEEALASYDRAIALSPAFAQAHYNRGNALHVLQRFDAALAAYDCAIALRPGYVEAVANRAATLHEVRRYGEALDSYRRAIALRPDFADTHYNEALCRLLLGDIEGGMRKHEWRWKTTLLRDRKRDFPQPLWLGDDTIEGKTILLHAEQGFGDTIQFCRYATQVAEGCGHVILEVQKPLLELMKSVAGTARVVARGEPLPDFDLHCPLLSLPLALCTRLETIPATIPYLSAGAEKKRAWRDRLGGRDKPRIGLVWAGNPRKELPGANRIDRQRSIAFDRLAPLLQVSACTFYSLQKGDDAVTELRDSPWSRKVIDHSDDLHDFAETAALIDNLDLVISVDTAVAHLAGALGKPFWLLNRYNTCWRWLLDRDDSPWYPTARLFRQGEANNWDGVITRVQIALQDHVRGWRARTADADLRLVGCDANA